MFESTAVAEPYELVVPYLTCEVAARLVCQLTVALFCVTLPELVPEIASVVVGGLFPARDTSPPQQFSIQLPHNRRTTAIALKPQRWWCVKFCGFRIIYSPVPGPALASA